MSKKTISIILSVIIIGAFFLPYISNGEFGLSGYDIVFGKGEIGVLQEMAAVPFI